MPFSRRKMLFAMSVTSGVLLSGTMTSFSVMGASSSAGTPLKIGVIGAGWLGGTVAKLWVQAGHEVIFSSRHPDELRKMTAPLGNRAHVGTPAEAAKFGTVLLFAVPYDALVTLGKDLTADLKGKIVLDACNPSGWQVNTLAREAQKNGVGPTTARLLPGTRLVRAFSAVDATAIQASAERPNNRLGVPVASNDKGALDVAARLVTDAGCEPVITGDLSSATLFQRGSPAFRANTSAQELRRLMNLN